MRNTYYALATDEKGNKKVIDNLSDIRIEAYSDAIKHCRKENLLFVELRAYKNSNDGNGILTKNMMEERKLKGVKGYKPQPIYWS